ncbi:MAG: D-alanine--D-alanine ligase [Bacteroidaceae bacterium]|nr:D-alanine--D-alanine ligase [Bacteroidaceae bacterium]
MDSLQNKRRRIIAIVAGGDSSEHDVSMRSAQGIYSFIDKEQYECYIIEITRKRWQVLFDDGEKCEVNKADFSFVLKGDVRVRPDFAYITIHGAPGENGVMQGYFDLVGISYSTSGVLVEALTFNKYFLNQFLRPFGVNIADSILVRKKQKNQISEEKIIERLGLPCFVKPSSDGSSFGVTKVKTAGELAPAIQKAMEECDEVMIEQFIDGREITCGCYKTCKVERVFPITEVVTDNEFFDYGAKYQGQVKEITPARISSQTSQRVSQLTSKLYDILNCQGIIRIDYILSGTDGQETINLLEINTTPGMTATSFIPQQVKVAGLTMGEVLSDIIENHF